ncbi:MAG TPA: glycosyl hydrolase [Saprospiraceae bacterium]|nr:glycosyl hydrolase [Saprospiraceae bacterium]
MKKTLLQFYVLIYLFSVPFNLSAQKKKTTLPAKPAAAAPAPQSPPMIYDTSLYAGMRWRSIGPYRGGRSCTVTGVPGKPNLYYFGSTGGGVWKTENGGNTWKNVSDGYFGGSIGAVAVSASDPNVVYAGGGEKTVRGNTSFGYGVWKSEDAGNTWKSLGLDKTRFIGRIRIHPTNPDIVFVAAIGNIFAPHLDRGIFKSTDGGKNWKKVLFVNDTAGAVDLCFDPNNPRILFATTWKIRRTPYSLESGGAGSALWKSTDSGETWTNISANKGLPSGVWGIAGVSVSPVNSDRVYALIENENGGVFRSDDGGKTWTTQSQDRNLRQRAWYYTRIYADTKDLDVVYVLNVSYHKSKDGGKTFSSFNANHGDHHDLWIAPEDPARMAIADDGGAQVTVDGGASWSTYHNQPTAQFYRVTTDNHFPYRIYIAQQDNTTLRIYHRTEGFAITENDWEPSAGGESGHLAVDPLNNDIVYGGSYDGLLERTDHSKKIERSVDVHPDNPMGHGAEGFKYRFQWNFPIFFSPHDPKKLYAASNHLHVTRDEGQTWQLISPDLTRNDLSKMGPSGGPITKDNTSVEYYCTIFAAAESRRVRDLIWTGSDDGLVHVSRDGGNNWTKVTPPDMPEWTMINCIEPDPFLDGGCYFAATGYKQGDFAPYIYKTEDFGKTWKKIVSGIPGEHFTRVVRADPGRKGLLYAGTETGMYISFNDGESWQPFQMNLPIVPITDLAIKNNNLIAATQGRALWIIDDLSPLHQLSDQAAKSAIHLYKPMDAYRMGGYGGFRMPDLSLNGQNHPGGVLVNYYLSEAPGKKDTITLAFHEENGRLIKTFSNFPKENEEKFEPAKGYNTFSWNLRYPNAKRFDGLVLWAGSLNGPMAAPGKYKVEIKRKGAAQSHDFNILKNPVSSVTEDDIRRQVQFVNENIQKLTETHQTIIDIRETRAQIKAYTEKIKDNPDMKDVIEKSKSIDSVMTRVEEALYQTKNRSGQDPLNFPIRLNNKLAYLNTITNRGDFPPTQSSLQVRGELVEKINAEIVRWQEVQNKDIPALNALIKSKAIDPISIKKQAKP